MRGHLDDTVNMSTPSFAKEQVNKPQGQISPIKHMQRSLYIRLVVIVAKLRP
jgi:hypothetical protein